MKEEEKKTTESSKEDNNSSEEKKSEDIQIKFKKCTSSKIKNLRKKSSCSDNDD